MAFGLLLPLGGCSSSKENWLSKHKPRTSREWLDLALEAEAPDERRAGVNGLAQSRDAASDWAVKAFDTIARTDTDSMVRCAAVRALGVSIGPERVPTVLKLLRSEDERIDGVRPAPNTVRWEAGKLLLTIVAAHAHDDPQRDEIVKTIQGRLLRDNDRNVRLAMIEALGYFAEKSTLISLIDVMEAEEDFALQHAAENALIALTGTTHYHDAAKWRQWLAETPDPFDRAGETPPDLAGKQDNEKWWDWGEW